jgi:hypothetical protein
MLHAGATSKSDHAIPKTLWNLAQDTLRECKKALAIATPCLATNGGKPPSGNTMVADHCDHVLDEMWSSKQKEKEAKVKVIDGDDEEASEAKDDEEDGDEMDNAGKRPEEHMFNGFVAFALLGPHVPEGFESNRLLELFDRDDGDEDGSCSMDKKLIKRVLDRKLPDRKLLSWHPRTDATR